MVSNVTNMKSGRIFRKRTVGSCVVLATTFTVLAVPSTLPDAKAATSTSSAVDPSSPLCIRRTSAPEVGLEFLSTIPVADRLSEVSFRSRALNGATVKANVLLPPNYDKSGATRYPVLYLFHGRSGDHTDWYKKGGIAAVNQQVITVMADAGTVGWHADWMGEERIGPDKGKPAPAWETFHIKELIPWVDSNYHTRGDRSARAIAGLSMGGYGAVLYAARHPEVFGVVGSLSGQLDMLAGYPIVPLLQTYGGNLFELKLPDPCIWGDPVIERVNWEDHSPFQLYSNLRGVKLFIAAGNGVPAKLSADPVKLGTEIIGEVAFRQMSMSLAKRLDSVGIDYKTHYTSGGHNWDLWPKQLAAFYPFMLEAANAPAASSIGVNFSYRTAEPNFSAWDWEFQVNRSVREFTYLEQVNASGLAVTGSGRLDVTTAALYAPGGSYKVSFNGLGTQQLVADGSGRLSFSVDLGPANLVQQKRFDSGAMAGFRKVIVAISQN